MTREQEQNPNFGPVVTMPDREVIVRKMQELGVLGISEQTNGFFYRLAEILDRAQLNGAGLTLIWETSIHESLSGLPPVTRSAVGMDFDRIVDAITPDAEVADNAKKSREALMVQLAAMAKAAEPNPDDLGPEDSLQDLERYSQARRIADLIFEYVSPDYRVTDRPWKEDRRDEGANPFYNQTHRGFFLEAYYGSLGRLWTPWGKYSFGGSGCGSWEEVTPKILERLGATLCLPEEYREYGVVGPVYALHKIDEVELPDPVEQPRSHFRTYEEAKQAWDDLTRQYHESKGEKSPLTATEKFALDDAILKARGEQEPPINENDIRQLWELSFYRGKVVKYTQDGGQTWHYAKVSDQDPQYFKGGNLGFSIYAEVLPHTQLHSSRALTDRDFEEGVVVRPTTQEEVKGLKFSYEFSDDEEKK